MMKSGFYKYGMSEADAYLAYRLNKNHEEENNPEDFSSGVETILKYLYQLIDKHLFTAEDQIPKKKEAIKKEIIGFIDDFPFLYDYIKESQHQYYNETEDHITFFCIFESSTRNISEIITIQKEEIPALKSKCDRPIYKPIINEDKSDRPFGMSEKEIELSEQLMTKYRSHVKIAQEEYEAFLGIYTEYLNSIMHKYEFQFMDDASRLMIYDEVKEGIISFLKTYPFLIHYILECCEKTGLTQEDNTIIHNIIFMVDNHPQTIPVIVSINDIYR